jgi:hypothetical protein
VPRKRPRDDELDEHIDERVDERVDEEVHEAISDELDPLIDTAVRRIEAQADDDNPFGKPGRPLSRRSPFRVAFTAALGVALAYALVQAVVAVRSVLILLLISAFLAIGLNPAVEALERRGMSRGRAVGVVLVGVLLFFVFLHLCKLIGWLHGQLAEVLLVRL